jgi:formylglycine-generating enzyme required for sulfatase activity
LKSGDSFRECAKDCPEMVVLPAGEFMMGSSADDTDHYDNEGPLPGHDRPAACSFEVRGDVRRVGCLRRPWRLRACA